MQSEALAEARNERKKEKLKNSQFLFRKLKY